MRLLRRPAPLFADTLRIDGPSFPTLLLGIALFSLITFLRWPEILLHPTFWGEDGWFWWPDARKFGLQSLFMPHTGYFQTDSRLIGLLAAPFPLKDGPLIFALAAFIFQILPPVYLLSSRCAALCPSTALRFVIGAILCAMPNCWEVYANLTNSQWHLAVLAFLIIVASPPRTVAGWVFDGLMLIVSGLSGPFAVFLVPVAAWVAWSSPDKVRFARLGLVLACAAIQAGSILQQPRDVAPHLGASLTGLARLIAGQIIAATLVGHLHLPHLYTLSLWKDGMLPWTLALGGVWLMIEACRRFPVVRLYGVFAFFVLAASLWRPLAWDASPMWELLLLPDSSVRYFYIPITFWLVTLVTLSFAASASPARNFARIALGVCVLVGIPYDWRMPAEPDRGFPALSEKYETLPSGGFIDLPMRPNTHFILGK
ncbi:hypothetical protein [Acetobacter conturbans]|uniref:DUF2029 domain-containing protein n=1 Tax=Acetobacter conturbans TaxID=1737472 RepID=A0ABX0K3Y1_9PROT|nr:hypothetical protein [Acetobacter conturbans]NHN88702.1 hypothetical protein [Acetobacter conturbans]